MSRLLWAARYALLIFLIFIGSVYSQSVDPIVIKGSKFFYKTNGTEFFIKGVVYQQNGYYATYKSDIAIVDPFIDGPTCARDIPFLIDANVNVVRSYAVLPGQDHSACMEELAQAGIYVLMDLTGNLPGHKINITNPTWNYPLYDYMTSVVDTFHNYTNVLGFFVGTEVINSTETISAPFVKAAARDVKAYIKSKDYRAIPVGYAMADQSAIRQSQVAYLNCGADEDDAVDFLGLDSYVWCGNSTFTESGYSGFVSEWSNLSIPIFLSEYGCNQPSPRTFTEVTAIYSEKMTQVFSGGCVYQYFHDTADYGLVDVFADSVSTSSDYSYFAKQMATIAPSGGNSKSYSPTNTPLDCPTTDNTWLPVPTLPPTPYSRLCKCMMQSLTCISSQQQDVAYIGDAAVAICESKPALCAGVSASITSGNYGAYATCNSTEIASWILNEYYVSQSNSTSACKSKGGRIQQPFIGEPADCAILLRQAGASGTGTITSTPSPPASAATDNSSGGSSGESSGSSSNTTGSTIGGFDGTGSSSSGLSGGAIAGIVIGILAVLAIIGTLAFFLWRARRKNRTAPGTEPTATETAETKAELPAGGVYGNEAKAGPRQEADGQPVSVGGVSEYYKQGNRGPAELQAQTMDPVELPAPHGVNEAGVRSPVEPR